MIVDEIAEAMWKEEAVRAMGRERSISWHEIDDESRRKWRVLAQAAIWAMVNHLATEVRRPVKS